MIITWVDAGSNSFSCDSSNESQDYRFDKLSGLEGGGANWINQQAPFQHGQTVIRPQGKALLIQFELFFFGTSNSDAETKRRTLAQRFSPFHTTGEKNRGTLSFAMDYGTTFFINAVPQSIVIPPATAPHVYRALVTMFSDGEPFFFTAQEELGLTEGTPVAISNGGELPTRPKLIVTGPCNGARFTNNTTGKFVEVTDYALLSGHRLEIDCAFDAQPKVVDILISSGAITDLMIYVPSDATFWDLLVGTNNILYDSVDNLGTTPKIQWYEKFRGIG